MDKIANAIAFVLAMLAFLRVASLTLALPFTAFANQGDLARYASCLEIWPASASGEPSVAATPWDPAQYLVQGRVESIACTPTIGAAFARLALIVRETVVPGGTHLVDVRVLAFIYLALLVAVSAWVYSRLHEQAWSRLCFSLLLLLVVADPFNALFLPSLYTEAPGAIGLLACLGVIVHANKGLTAGSRVVFLFGMVLLGLARQANLALPLLLGIVLAMSVPRSELRRKPMAILLAAALGLFLAQLWMSRAPDSTRAAQRTNAILLTLAAQSQHPARFIRSAGLPEHCLEAVGASHFTGLKVQPTTICPEISTLGASRVLWAAVLNPRAVIASLRLSNLVAGHWGLPYLAQLSGGEGERRRAVEAKPYSAWSFTDAMPWLQVGMRWILFFTPVLAGMAALCLTLLRGSSFARSEALLVATGGVIGSLLVVNVLGDGIGEPTRHAHLAILALPVAWGAMIVLAVRQPWPFAPILGASALLCGATHMASPSAHGFAHQEDNLLRGWVVAKDGVSELRVLLGSQEVAVTVLPDPEVDAFFGMPSGASRAWRMTVPTPAACQPLRFEARSGSGRHWVTALQLTAHPDGIVRYRFGCGGAGSLTSPEFTAEVAD